MKSPIQTERAAKQPIEQAKKGFYSRFCLFLHKKEGEMEGEEKSKIKWWMFLIVFLVIAGFFVSYRIISEKTAGEKNIAAVSETANIAEAPENYPFPVYNDSAGEEVKEQLPTCLQDEKKGYTSCSDEEYFKLAIANNNASLCDRIIYGPIRNACVGQIK